MHLVSQNGPPDWGIGFLSRLIHTCCAMPVVLSSPKLANDGHDTRALQHYLGHRNIQHTVRYTEMAPDRFKDFWRG